MMKPMSSRKCAALGRLVHADRARRFRHPLPLIAARLRVLLDRHGAPVGHLAHGRQCVAGIVDLVRARGVARVELSPVLKPRGPIISPASMSSAVGNMFTPYIDGSSVVVTPYAI